MKSKKIRLTVVLQALCMFCLMAVFPGCDEGGSGKKSVPQTSWYSFLGANGNGMDARQTRDGGYIITGYAGYDISALLGQTPVNPYVGSSDIFVAKLDSAGSVSWHTYLGSSAGSDVAESVQQTGDGGFIIAGTASEDIASLQGISPVNPFSSGGDMLIVKLDTAGSVSWYTFLGGTSSDEANSIQQTSDSGYIITGIGNGGITTLQGKTPINAYVSARDMLVVKLTSAGSVDWCTFLGTDGDDYAYSVKQAGDGGYVIAGTASEGIAALQTITPVTPYTTGNTETDMFIVKLTSAGNVSWFTFLGTTSDMAVEMYSIDQAADGGYILAGTATVFSDVSDIHGVTPINSYSAAGFTGDMLIVKLDSAGSLSWFTFLGSTGHESANSIKKTGDGGCIVAGIAQADIATLQGQSPLNAYSGGNDMLVTKLDSAGSVSWYTFLGGSGNETAYSIQQTGDKGYVIGGSATEDIDPLLGKSPVNAFNASGDMLIIKLKKTGSF
ncbi:MAG TPA: hypothetical protein P5346_10630 [Spirochaetota bacterium]|nr:hypothetical protein [Spirochaetota bacterium]HSA15183.1 hypothetical protein [Spirochaetota bacterium]